MWASFFGYLDVVKILLDARADAFVKDIKVILQLVLKLLLPKFSI